MEHHINPASNNSLIKVSKASVILMYAARKSDFMCLWWGGNKAVGIVLKILCATQYIDSVILT